MTLARAIGSFAGSAVNTVRRVAEDQKRIWSFPATAVRGTGWQGALAVAAATGVLIALDPVVSPMLQRAACGKTTGFRRTNRLLSGRNMAVAINAVPLSFQIVGFLLRDRWARQTASLASEAAASAEIVAMAMKHADRRMRPTEAGVSGDFTHTWFRTKNRNLDGAGGFPSGHTAASFAIATVFAERYRSHAWAPFAAYGLAGIVGVSRITTREHFPSDVFLGAALGYSISRFVVLPRSVRREG